jgi:hypothetical protein
MLPHFEKDNPITSLVIHIELKSDSCVIHPDSVLSISIILYSEVRNEMIFVVI